MSTDVTERITHWIDGKPWEGVGERRGDVYDPATGEVGRHVEFAGAGEIDEAVAAAARAYPAWRDTSLAARTRILFAFRELVNDRRDELARLIKIGRAHV